MASIRERNGKLFFDFRYRSIRCREYTLLDDTPANRKIMAKMLERIEAEITMGTFEYARYFPNSPMVQKFSLTLVAPGPGIGKPVSADQMIFDNPASPLFGKFAEEWFGENEISWKRSYRGVLKITLNSYLIPQFGNIEVSHITKGEILKFRSSLAKVQNGTKIGLSPDRINHIMTPLRMILNEAADRYKFSTPYIGIKQLRSPRSDVDPFSLDEVKIFLAAVRPDFRNYYTVRFFSGLRTAEIDGLKWQYVDFERRQIRIRETLVNGFEETTKTQGSARDVHMSPPVHQALKAQHEQTGHIDGFVFRNRCGTPLNRNNVMRRIWYPTLRLLCMKKRNPYQTRHTTATLWLAAGENPEWIARQMGHSTTQMLFTVYSRYVPNLTRQDGSAFERLVSEVLPEIGS